MTHGIQLLGHLAYHFFGVRLPIERGVLKGLFRIAVRRLHTDVAGESAKEEFLAMKAAYDALCAPDATGVFTDGPVTECTREGTPLDTLGLGLGAMKNGRECDTCKGKGYRSEKQHTSTWTPGLPCARCQLLRSTMGCRTCSGPHGFPTRFRISYAVENVHNICAPCQGSGEIELFNPVIPKGLLTSGSVYLGQKARKRLEKSRCVN